MPTAPPRICSHKGCTGLWNGERCTVCSRQPKRHGWDDSKRGPPAERGYDTAWQRLRLAYLKRHPACELCEEEDGRTVAATQVHHREGFGGLKDPKRLDWGNLQALCGRHHARLSAEESHAGRKGKMARKLGE